MMGGIDIVGLLAEMERRLVNDLRDLFGLELTCYWHSTPHFDIFERMRIANESGLMFRG